MKIKSSLDWSNLQTKLNNQNSDIGYNRDLAKLISNVNEMVQVLSNLEVEARRIGKTYRVDEQLVKINNTLNLIKKYLTIMKLTK